MKHRTISPSRGFAILLAVLLIGIGNTAFAHGPTVEISHGEMKPSLLNLFVGSTVHFVNTVEMPGGHVVLDESGTIKSSALAKPGDDWHYTFDSQGTFELYLEQHPKTKMRIVIVPKRAHPGP